MGGRRNHSRSRPQSKRKKGAVRDSGYPDIDALLAATRAEPKTDDEAA